MPTTLRRHVVVDLETTGTELHHQTTEAAWYDLGTDEYDHFFVPHTLDGADPVALELTRYHERIAGQTFDDGTKTRQMWERLGGDGAKVTIWGANPGFDQRFLMGLFPGYDLSAQPFHHRPMDPCSGAYWLFPEHFAYGETPGLKDVATLLNVEMSHHEALADVLTTVAVIRKVNAIREARARIEVTR
jgi:DNA polymerase III epsilon subunit-like protein